MCLAYSKCSSKDNWDISGPGRRHGFWPKPKYCRLCFIVSWIYVLENGSFKLFPNKHKVLLPIKQNDQYIYIWNIKSKQINLCYRTNMYLKAQDIQRPNSSEWIKDMSLIFARYGALHTNNEYGCQWSDKDWCYCSHFKVFAYFITARVTWLYIFGVGCASETYIFILLFILSSFYFIPFIFYVFILHVSPSAENAKLLYTFEELK